MHPEAVSNIILFINKYNCDGVNYPSKIDDWKTIEKKKLIIALTVLHSKEMEICPAFISKINSDCEKQIILLMIAKRRRKRLAFTCWKKIYLHYQEE